MSPTRRKKKPVKKKSAGKPKAKKKPAAKARKASTGSASQKPAAKAKKKASGGTSASKKRTMGAAKALTVNAWQVCVRSRGPNPDLAKQCEDKFGGDRDHATPYAVGPFDGKDQAERLASCINQAGGEAEVQSAGGKC